MLRVKTIFVNSLFVSYHWSNFIIITFHHITRFQNAFVSIFPCTRARNTNRISVKANFDARVSFFPLYSSFCFCIDRIETSGSRPSGWRTRFRNRWEQSSCGVETRRGNIVVLGHRWSGTGLERHLATITYRLLSAISAENRFARHVIVAIWSTTSNRHDTRISIKPLATEDRISPSYTLSGFTARQRDPANFFFFFLLSPITILGVVETVEFHGW